MIRLVRAEIIYAEKTLLVPQSVHAIAKVTLAILGRENGVGKNCQAIWIGMFSVKNHTADYH